MQLPVVFCLGSGVSVPVREHPGHVGARPPHRVRRRHLRKERLSEGKPFSAIELFFLAVIVPFVHHVKDSSEQSVM